MPSRAALAFLALAVAGILALAVRAAADDRELAFTLGLVPFGVAARIDPGQEACQVPVIVEERFRAVRFAARSKAGPGGPVAVTVRAVPSRRTLATGRRRGVEPRSRPTVRLDRDVPEDARVAVCVRNAGKRPLALLGRARSAKLNSRVEVDGRPRATDMTLVFLRRERRSVLGLVPEMFRRAALFRPAWVGAWSYWVLLALVLCAVPALLATALASAARQEDAIDPRESGR